MRHSTLLVFLSIAPMTVPVFGQSIVYDWQGGDGGTLINFPKDLVKTQSVPFTIQNTNSLLYSYGVGGSCTQNVVDPWGTISPILTTVAAPVLLAADACLTPAKTASDAWDKVDLDYTTFRKLPATGALRSGAIAGCSSAKPCRISLSAAKQEWMSSVDSDVNIAQTAIDTAINACKANPTKSAEMVALGAKLSEVKSWYTAPNDWHGNVSVSPDSSCKFTINEAYLGVATTPAGVVEFTAGQPRMTLSAGPLFSKLQNRSYSVATAPPANGNTANQSVLQVTGDSSLTPYLVGLLNFALPTRISGLNSENFGLTASTGPVVRIGSQSTASPFGWFAGGSYHLYHLIYASAGIHIGQFSDFPVGFSAAGQPVPSGFPTPTAQNKIMTKFAFGITVKATDLKALGKTGSDAKKSQ